MTSSILHGVLAPVVPCSDPKCPICAERNSGDDTGFSDPDREEELEEEDDTEWPDDEFLFGFDSDWPAWEFGDDD